MVKPLMILVTVLTWYSGYTAADVTIDLAKAEFDETLGQFCVMQKVRYSVL